LPTLLIPTFYGRGSGSCCLGSRRRRNPLSSSQLEEPSDSSPSSCRALTGPMPGALCNKRNRAGGVVFAAMILCASRLSLAMAVCQRSDAPAQVSTIKGSVVCVVGDGMQTVLFMVHWRVGMDAGAQRVTCKAAVRVCQVLKGHTCGISHSTRASRRIGFTAMHQAAAKSFTARGLATITRSGCGRNSRGYQAVQASRFQTTRAPQFVGG